MLVDRLCQLLTAYLDGELGARQSKAVVRLLHKSSEARALFRKLQEDAHALRDLPRRQLGRDFSAKALRAIADRGLQPARPAPRPRPAPIPASAGLAAAAAELEAVCSPPPRRAAPLR